MSTTVDQIKQRLDLTDVIRQYIKVEKAGSNFKACCPFHNEKTPSFYISPSRNVWHCFGCSKGGSVFDFVMEIEKMDFSEALTSLAKRAGIEIKKENPAVANERTGLLKILESAKNFYAKKLEENERAMSYLINERGLIQETIKEFELGYALDDWRTAFNFLRNQGFSEQDILKTGLVIKSDKPPYGYYDRFRGRIMFPINDQSGRTVAFGGRIFTQTSDVVNNPDAGHREIEPAKYINSPQTVLYDKSRVLYNFNKAKFEIGKQDFCVLVEGYMDAIMSYQAGIKNVVAVSGTALTHGHLDSIGRLVKSVVTSFDSDAAGSAATERSIDLLLEKGFEIKVLDIKGEKDPADLIKKDKKLWEEAVTQKKSDIIDFYLDFLKNKYGEDDLKFAAEAKNMIFPRLILISNEIEKSLWIRKMANRVGVKEDAVWLEFQKFNNAMARQKKNGFHPSGDRSNVEKQSDEADNQNKQTRLARLEERIIGILAIAYSEPIKEKSIKDKLSGVILKDLDNFSVQHQLFLKKILENGNAKTNEENTFLQTLALKTEVFYNLNDDEFELEFLSLLNDLKKERIRDKLNVLGVEIKKINKEQPGDILHKIEEFNQLSKELKNL